MPIGTVRAYNSFHHQWSELRLTMLDQRLKDQ